MPVCCCCESHIVLKTVNMFRVRPRIRSSPISLPLLLLLLVRACCSVISTFHPRAGGHGDTHCSGATVSAQRYISRISDNRSAGASSVAVAAVAVRVR